MKIEPDKVAHFWAGLAIMLAVSLFGGWVIGLIAAVAAGLLKEAYDMTGRGTPDIWDAVATGLGGVAGAGLYLIKDLV
jgi:hypothetical protein